MKQKLTVLAPHNGTLEQWGGSALLPVFNPQAVSFLHCISEHLLKTASCRQHPELVALGFWLRSANINQLSKSLTGLNKPLGNVVHFTPANVDTMFVYSWVCSVLLGNRNVVRVASNSTVISSCIINVLNLFLAKDEFKDIARANLFISYDKYSLWSQKLSELADARVIWGGDESVQSIRGHRTPPRCRDICFADRHSAALINGDGLEDGHVGKVAALLWKDTSPYQQQACSSPRIVFWLGSQSKQLKFFSEINKLRRNIPIELNQKNEHLVTCQLLQAKQIGGAPLVNSLITAIPVNHVNPDVYAYHCGSGMFFVYNIEQLETLTMSIEAKTQTLSYWGVDKATLLRVLENPSITGVDRIVPLGQSLDFDVVWDGFDVLSQLSRKVVVK